MTPRHDPQAELTALVQRLVDARLREYAAALETWCERSLTDPAGRGVLVLDHEDGSWEMSLDADVPYGCIHHRQVRS